MLSTSICPSALNVNTINNRSPGAISIFNPSTVPDAIVPIGTGPVKPGCNSTNVSGIGVNILFAVVPIYNCAKTVTVVLTKLLGDVVLNNAEIEVIVPTRGTEKANVVSSFVRLIVGSKKLVDVAELPNPIKAGNPGNPPVIVPSRI